MQQSIINDIVTKIQLQQEKLIKKRFLRLIGFELDIEQETKRRFPRLGIFHQDNEISYYWNDGSIDGIRIITFIQEPINFNDIENGKLSVGLSYR